MFHPPRRGMLRSGLNRPDGRPARVDAVLFVNRHEQRGDALGGFRGAQKQIAAGGQREMEGGQGPLLHLAI